MNNLPLIALVELTNQSFDQPTDGQSLSYRYYKNKHKNSKHGLQNENLTPKLRHIEGYQTDPHAPRIHITFSYIQYISS